MQMSNIQVVNLADNINAAVLKINQNFDGIVTGDIPLPTPTESGGVDTGETNNLINNYLDSSVFNDFMATFLDSNYFLTVINEDYLQQFTINTNVNDSDIQANASAIFTLESRIDNTDSGILVLSQALIQTQASLDSMVLGGIDSDLLASAIASANTSVISRIEANSDQIVSFAGIIDSVENNLLLFDSDTNERIDINTSAISSLTSRINVNSDGLSVVLESVDSLGLTLDQFIQDGINITPEMIDSAMAGAGDTLTIRMNADSDKLVIEAAKIVELETGLAVVDSDLNTRVEALSEAQSELISRTEYDSSENRVTALASDITTLNNNVFVTDENGNVTTAVAEATSALESQITTVDGKITSVTNQMQDDLIAKIDSDISQATQTLTALIDSEGNTISTWGIDLVAGTESNPKVAGIKFGNDGTTADFEITADTFKILPTDGTGNGTAPFSVTAEGVELSNAKVTGEIDVTTSDDDGSMNIKGNLITISDANGATRIKLGKLT
jgi:hypothetical protein